MQRKQQQEQPLTVQKLNAYAAKSRQVHTAFDKAQDDLIDLYPKLHALNKDTSNVNNGLKEANGEELDDIDEEKVAAQIKKFITRYQNLSKEKNELFKHIKSIYDQHNSIEKLHGVSTEAKEFARDLNEIDAEKKAMLASTLKEDEKKCNDILRQCGDHIQDLMSLFPEVDFDTLPTVITVGTDEFSESEDDDVKAQAHVQSIARESSTRSTESTDSDDSDKLEAPKKATRSHVNASAVHGTHLNEAKRANAAAKQGNDDGPTPDSQCVNCVIL